MAFLTVRALREALVDVAALVLPVDCAGCGAFDRSVCDSCAAALTPDVAHRATLTVNGRPIPVVAAFEYSGIVRRVLAAAKDGDRVDTLTAFAAPLREAAFGAARLAGQRAGFDASGAHWLFVPVPTTTSARRRRGGWPLGAVVYRSGLRATRVLRARAAGRAQKSLGRAERFAAVRDRFSVAPFGQQRLLGRAVILIDDVVTTGATLTAVADVVERAGGHVVAAAVIAATPRYDGRSREFSADRV